MKANKGMRLSKQEAKRVAKRRARAEARAAAREGREIERQEAVDTHVDAVYMEDPGEDVRARKGAAAKPTPKVGVAHTAARVHVCVVRVCVWWSMCVFM